MTDSSDEQIFQQISGQLKEAETELDRARTERVVADALSDPTLRAARFAVNGHTDDVGDTAFNDDLSERRAASVARYLSETRTIDPARLEIRYFGETQPLDLDKTPTARQLNRRVEFELLR